MSLVYEFVIDGKQDRLTNGIHKNWTDTCSVFGAE